MKMEKKFPRFNASILFSIIILAGTIVYLAKRSVLEHRADIDFRFFWTAGKLWALGIDPYSPRFMALGQQMFPTGNPVVYWLYPPQWWAISRALAAFPVEQALAIWRGANAALLVAASAALALVVRRVRPATPPWAMILLVALMALMEATAQTLLLGQTAILVFAGYCLMCCALLTGRQLPMVAALVLLLLKPQFAIAAIIWFAVTKKWRLSVLIALAVTGLASLPHIAQFGLVPTLKGLLGIVAFHAQMNMPIDLIGFSHLVWFVTGYNLSNAVGIALDVLASLALGMMIFRRNGGDHRDQAALGIGLIASAMFFLPLHTYDTVALGPIAMLAIFLGRVPRTLAWAAVALATRAGVIGGLIGDRQLGDRLLLSLAGLLALIAAATAAWSRFRAHRG